MHHAQRPRFTAHVCLTVFALAVLAISTDGAFALQVPEKPSRFEALVIRHPSEGADVTASNLASLPASDRVRVGWERFRAKHGQEWSIYLDRQSGAPLFVQGSGIAFPTGKDTTVDSLATSLRAFIAGNKALLLAGRRELRPATRSLLGRCFEDVWQVVFERRVAGIPVDGESYTFTIGHGRLVSFGTPRWSRIDASPVPEISSTSAQERLAAYVGIKANEEIDIIGKPELRFIPLGGLHFGARLAADGPLSRRSRHVGHLHRCAHGRDPGILRRNPVRARQWGRPSRVQRSLWPGGFGTTQLSDAIREGHDWWE